MNFHILFKGLLSVVCLAVPCFICEVFDFATVAAHMAEVAEELSGVLQSLVNSVEVFCSSLDGTIRSASGL